ncbi:MAG: NAD(P)/FAD-dependent oxidoreductase, partial [Microbacterium sp.]|nr:NAD(P)/FAD-dependent oxidoreductase [Microbacterium sp.]
MAAQTLAVIGAGPSGLAAARALSKAGIAFDGYEASRGVGGLWDIENPRSTMYESAHLISSRTTTQFAEFPMDTDADYPGHRVLLEYFRAYAERFGLATHYLFGTRVTAIDRAAEGGWMLRATGPDGETEKRYDGVVIANGTLAEPNVPRFPGRFDGEILHTSAYKTGPQLAGRRV